MVLAESLMRDGEDEKVRADGRLLGADAGRRISVGKSRDGTVFDSCDMTNTQVYFWGYSRQGRTRRPLQRWWCR
jgi:hypothetical protein